MEFKLGSQSKGIGHCWRQEIEDGGRADRY